jgi:hypothetical protein
VDNGKNRSWRTQDLSRFNSHPVSTIHGEIEKSVKSNADHLITPIVFPFISLATQLTNLRAPLTFRSPLINGRKFVVGGNRKANSTTQEAATSLITTLNAVQITVPVE